MMQRDVKASYDVEKAIKDAIFTEETDTLDENGPSGIAEKIANVENLYGWLGDNIQRIFTILVR